MNLSSTYLAFNVHYDCIEQLLMDTKGHSLCRKLFPAYLNILTLHLMHLFWQKKSPMFRNRSAYVTADCVEQVREYSFLSTP